MTSFPYFVDWEITSMCNFNCGFCYNKNYRRKDLHKEELLRIAKKLAGTPVLEVKLGGGEPALKKTEVVEISKILKQNSKSVAMVTNGSPMTPDFIDELKPLMSRIEISLHSADEKKFNEATGTENQFKKVLENIKLISDSNISMCLNFVLSSKNAGEIDRIYHLSKKYGAKLRILRYRGFEFQPDKSIQNRILSKFRANDDIVLDHAFRKEGACGAIKNVIAISPLGFVYPCSWLKSKKLSLGNILNDNLGDILETEKAKVLQENLSRVSEREKDCPYFFGFSEQQEVL